MGKKSFFFTNMNEKSKGYSGEKILFDAIEKYFDGRECVAKHGYIMNFSGNKFTIETDVILLDKDLGINMFEVKGIGIDNISSISTDGWNCRGIYKNRIDPIYQLDRNATNIIDFLKECDRYSDGVGVKPVLVLPYITSAEWKREGFNKYAFLPPIIFKDDIENEKNFFQKLNNIPYKCKAIRSMKDYEFENIRKILFGQVKEKVNVYKVISEEEFLKQLL